MAWQEVLLSPNIKPYNYVMPIPIQIINSNIGREIKQNYGYK